MTEPIVGTYIGHYGCFEGDAVVRVRAPSKTKPHHLTVWMTKCPACNREHRFKPAWRVAEYGELKNVKLQLKESHKISDQQEEHAR